MLAEPFLKKKPTGTGAAQGIAPRQPLEADGTTPVGREGSLLPESLSGKLNQQGLVPATSLTTYVRSGLTTHSSHGQISSPRVILINGTVSRPPTATAEAPLPKHLAGVA